MRAAHTSVKAKVMSICNISNKALVQVLHALSGNITVFPAQCVSSAIGMSRTCLCLPMQPQLVLIYRPRRDGRLSTVALV